MAPDTSDSQAGDPVSVTDDEIFLPVPELGEVHTHLACPACEGGEVPIAAADRLACRSCGAVFELGLAPTDETAPPSERGAPDESPGWVHPDVLDAVSTRAEDVEDVQSLDEE